LAVALVSFSGVVVFGQSPATRPAAEPNSQPSKYDHDDMVKQIAKEPLATEEYHSKAGKPLTDEQLADVEKSNKLLESAREFRAKGDYAAATEACGKALTTYKPILSGSHHRVISAQILSNTMAPAKSASAEDQKKFAEADKLVVQAVAAHDNGQYEDALKAAQQALQIQERLLGKDHPDVGVTLRVMGNAQIELGRLSEAADSLDRALKIVEATYGPEHPQTALVLDRIGWLRINQRKPEDAVQTLTRAGRIFQKTVGETPEYAETVDNLGTAALYMRDPDRALKSKLRAYVIREKLLGPEAKDTGVSLSNLAWLYSELGLADAEQAVALRKRAMAIFEKSLGPKHPWTSLEAVNLAHVYAAQGNYDEACKLGERLVAQDQEHPDVLTDRVVDRLVNLGAVYLAMGRTDDGLRALDKALEFDKTLYTKGEVQPAIAQMDAMANLYQSSRAFEEAAKAAETLRGWTAKTDQKPDETALNRMLRLGSIYRELGRLDDAKRVLEEAVRVTDSFKGDDVVKSVTPLITLSTVYEKLGQLEDAERIADQAMRVTESKLIRESRGQAYTMMTMGRIQVKQNRTDIGKFSLEEARKIFERGENRRNDPTGLTSVLQELAACHLAEGDKSGAVELHKQAVAQSRELAERVKNVNTKALLANAIRQLVKALPDDSADAKKESGALKAELKQLLDDLRKRHALNAENKEWLKELGE
jgi:tetratricopeptide (TPR) repeat protein